MYVDIYIYIYMYVFICVWIKIGYPNKLIVNTKNELIKIDSPQVFNFDPYPYMVLSA